MSGAAVSWNTFFLKNLIPVTLGNIVGGAVFVASAFSYTYGWLTLSLSLSLTLTLTLTLTLLTLTLTRRPGQEVSEAGSTE